MHPRICTGIIAIAITFATGISEGYEISDPTPVFTSDGSVGWTYTDEHDEWTGWQDVELEVDSDSGDSRMRFSVDEDDDW